MAALPFLSRPRRATDAEIYAASQVKIQRDLDQLIGIVAAMPSALGTGQPRRDTRNQAYQARLRCRRLLEALNEEMDMFDK